MKTMEKTWRLLTIMMVAMVSLSLSSCGGGDDDEPNGNNGGNNGGGNSGGGSTTEQVFTGSVADVTSSSATISGNFTSSANVGSLQLGVLYSTERSTIDNRQGVLALSSNIAGNSYTVELSNLQSNTIYYYRAYMVSGGNTYYGSVSSFTTSQGELVTTGDATDITHKSATISSTFRNGYITSFSELGVQYSDSKELVESDKGRSVTTSAVTSGNVFTVSLTNLAEQTTYYYRAYVKTSQTTYYGETKSFTTPKNSVDYNGHAYVDLGLPSGTKWATMNVGASKPEDYGDYYAWGETTTKTSYTEDNYKWKGLTVTEFVSRGIAQKSQESSPYYYLTASYDVATIKWGNAWRMPTHDDIEELDSGTKITKSTQNGVEGFLLTSIYNQKSIFLPATGEWGNSFSNTYYYPDFDTRQYTGIYWSSEIFSYYNDISGRSLRLRSSDLRESLSSFSEIYLGHTVRPVSSY